MATLEDCRPVIAELLDGLGMAAGADLLRYSAQVEGRLPADEAAELEHLREVIEAVRDALQVKGPMTGKLAAIRAALPPSA